MPLVVSEVEPRLKPAPRWVRWVVVAIPLCGMALFFFACRRKELSEKEVKTIAAELERVAQRATRRRAEIRLIRQPLSSREPSVATLQIRLWDRSRTDAVRQALLRVSREHKLSAAVVKPPAPPPAGPTGAVEKLEFRFRGRLTHIAVIQTARAPTASGQVPGKLGLGLAESAPRIAIIIDDLGRDRTAAETIFRMPYPLTVAVLPRQPHSAEVAERAHQEGLDVLLHLPMEPAGNEAKRERVELEPGMAPSEVRRTLEEEIEAIPHVVGVNNHEGSRATADPKLMGEVMEVLKQKRLFFVDSRTTPQTVAYHAALQARIAAAYRTVFLDSASPDAAHSVAYTMGQLKRLEKQSRATGWGLAIGHPHPSTLAALERYLPRLEQRGFRLVFASELVQSSELPQKTLAARATRSARSSPASPTR